MFCVRCGTALPEGAAYCQTCGMATTPASAATTPPAAAFPAPAAGAWPGTAALPATPIYSGFWRRFWSYVLDRFVLGVAFTPVFFFSILPMLTASERNWTDTDLPESVMTGYLGTILLAVFLGALASWLYYALMQSSRKQATLGQMALGIRVTDLEGRRITFARGTGRYFATVITGLTLGIGYLIMLFTDRKQTLHDLIAGTLVVR
jgi:uncharacterized RDD family membrane protein YckC